MNKLGIILGSFSGATWGLNTVIISMILTSNLFKSYEKNIFFISLVSVFFHDFFSAIWLSLNLVRERKIKDIVKPFKSKIGLFLIVGALLGGPIGMAGYLLGTRYIGASYTSIFSALYPALGTLLSILILKEKINLRIIVGMIICGMGIFFLLYVPIDLQQYPFYKMGIFFSIFCVLGWALECVIASYSMMYGEVDSSVAICIRQIISAIFYGIIIIPIIDGYPLVIEILKSTVVYSFVFTALIGSISYLFWYSAIDKIGASKAMVLNITYIVWTMIFSKLILKIDLSIQFVVSSIVILIGLIVILIKNSEDK